MDKEGSNINKKYPPRISNRVINHKYIAYTFDVLVKGTILPFDCYIKRYNDFVIIIEAGTFMSEELLEKLHNNKYIYFLKSNFEKINQYQLEHEIVSLTDTALDALGTSEEQLSVMYVKISNLMQKIFNNGDEKLPLNALRLSLIELVKDLNLDVDMFPMLLKIIPNVYTPHNHSTNVAFFAIIFAKMIKLSEEEILDIGLTGLLHDIGKIRIDKQLLLKPSRLEEDEYKTVKQHSEYGYMILKDNGIENQKILNGVHLHHERLDGSGYPKGFRDRLIPKYAKIIGICDAFDALTTKRTFRNHYTSYEALVVMKQEMATQFDNSYITILVQLLRPH